MSYPAPVSLLGIDRQPDKAPILQADAPGGGPSWAAEHKDALRAVVAEHGSIMVRGLGLRDATEVSAVFRQLSTGLMIEKEAFASRRIYSDGVYSSATWPANQPMCMHHELSYRLEVPDGGFDIDLSRAATPEAAGAVHLTAAITGRALHLFGGD